MKRILSGIKPSGEVTLGNYLGAMRRWAEMSGDDTTEHFFFIPNLHALTVRQKPEILRRNSLSAVAWLLAAGVRSDKAAIYVQSQVPAHSELNWVLENYVTMGELNRMTQFKDRTKKDGPEGQLVGLYTYPVLMAADILLYDADEVPVGEDQVQHIELARDIAQRFNNLYGDTFKLPRVSLQKIGARIMNLQNPNSKMSKSDIDDSGNILMSDSLDEIKRKVMRAVTDSGSSIQASDDKPAISNLLQIFSLVDGRSIKQLEEDYAGRGYGDFKSDLADALVGAIEPIQKIHKDVIENEGLLVETLRNGSKKANDISGKKIAAVKEKIGLL